METAGARDLIRQAEARGDERNLPQLGLGPRCD
jgi:hypothetical protein